MKNVSLLLLICLVPILHSFDSPVLQEPQGAFLHRGADAEEWILLKDNYFIHTSFNKALKIFNFSRGGACRVDGAAVTCRIEFDTRSAANVGSKEANAFQLKQQSIFIGTKEFKLSDNGEGELAGYYRISARKQAGQLSSMPLAARKTIKLLTGERFQWAAINTSTGEFFGTGGGSYSFRDGVYTEHIEFFSRDSSRVGATLEFKDSLQGKEWIHSGLSSKGDPIYEIWSREPIAY